MKIQCQYILLIVILAFTSIDTFECVAQSFSKIEYPYVTNATTDNVAIKAITFGRYETKIDFIACYTGHYIFLENAGQRNAMYIKIGKRKYNLQRTSGIASTDRATICQPGQLLEFTAFFDPIPDHERDNFDLIEGIDGTWNFYKVSISKYLSREKVPDFVAIGQRNWDKINFKAETIQYPYVESQSHPYLIIKKIDKLNDSTIIYFTYKKPYDSYNIINLSKKIYIRTLDGNKYDIINVVGVPTTNEFVQKGYSLSFYMVFPRLSNDVVCFSLYQSDLFYDAKGLAFHNIKLHSDYNGFLKKMNDMDLYFKNTSQKKTPYQNTNRKKLKKNPNFKIE